MPFFGRAFNIFRKPQSSEETPQDSVQDPPESSSKANKGFYPSAGPSEAPPAYEQAYLPSQKTSTADPLRALAKYDTIFLVDDSGSMTTLIDNRRDPYYTRWEQVRYHSCCRPLPLAAQRGFISQSTRLVLFFRLKRRASSLPAWHPSTIQTALTSTS